MAILINKKTGVLVQGATGGEGSRATQSMLAYGVAVLAGVTPGKGGERVHGVPVYNTVSEALARHPGISATLLAVPAAHVRAAAVEAIGAGVKLVNVLTERMFVRDAAQVVQFARAHGTILVGPSSVGIISPGQGKIGSIGSGEAERVFSPGPTGIVSKSGGMTAEIASVLTRAGLGQSTALGIGGDQIIGFDFVDALSMFAKDRETKAVVLFGEIGGTYEELAADFMREKKFAKPVVAVIAGKFAMRFPQGTVMGHAGAIVAKGRGSYDSKVKALRGAGAKIARTLDEVPDLLRAALREKMRV